MVPRKQTYVVRLTAKQREALIRMTSSGRRSARELKRAQILLLTDRSKGSRMQDKEVAKALNVGTRTVQRIRQTYCVDGLDISVFHKKGAGRPKKIDATVEAAVAETARSKPPPGRARWTLKLVAERVSNITGIHSLSCQSVCNVLKKLNLNLQRSSAGQS